MRTNDRAAWAHAAARALSRSGRRMLSLTLSLVLALTLLPGMALAAEGDVAINEDNFPDANFRTYISEELDTDEPKGTLSAAEIDAVTAIKVPEMGIADLTGIAYFENLETLSCAMNQLTSLDVSKNVKLTKLFCDSNQLETLDVSKNTELTMLYCGENQLKTLDLSQNTKLTSLICTNNHLTSLDLSNTKVTALDTGGNQYTMGLKEGVYTFDLNTLPGEFDVDKVLKGVNLIGGTITGKTLSVNAGAEMVRYKYNCGTENAPIYADFRLRVHSADVHKIGLTQTETRVFRDLTVGYTTVESYNFYIRNDGNIPTGDLKVVLEGANASAFKLSDEDGKSAADGSISVSSLGLNGLASPNINYQPKAGLKAGTYTATVAVKDSENKTMASFNISLTVKDPTSAGFTLSKTTYAFPALQYGYTAVSPFTVTVTNTGSQATGNLTVTCDSSYFEVAPADISSISENGTATFRVRPRTGLPVGSHSGTVTVTNGTESQSFHVSLEVQAAEKVAAPVITPSGGSFTEPQTVTITCGTEGASIFYTTDGSDIDVKSTPYTDPFTVTQTTTIKAKATKANMENSDTVTVTITISSGGGTGGGGTTPTTPTQPAAPKLPFTDVSEDDWFYADAAYLYEKGVMKGTADETFAPGRSVTRGQLAAALYRMAGEPAVTAKAAFTDVPADYWCAAAITWAAESGVVTGYGDGGFRPADAVQRQELAAMLFRFAVYQGMSAVTLEENLAPFADRADVAAYAVPAMNWAVGQGILQGKDGSLLPQAPVDRAQLAAMLRRYLEK